VTKGFIEQEFITLERALLGDTVRIRWRQIRAMSGAADPLTPPGQVPAMVDGATTVYLEGELGFAVNHTQDEIIGMIAEKEVVH